MTTTIETIDVDPNELLVDSNIRHSSKLDKDFLASVKELGVVVPIVALRTASGDLRVRFGHRRTAAAIAGELKTVPVLVAGTEGDGDEAQVDRLVKQYAENTHRAELTSAEKIDVVTQLSAFGVKATEITKKTRIPKAEVKAAATVAKSDVASTVTARYDLTLDQATAVAEFEDDKAAVKELVVTAEKEPEQFAHKLQELRDQRTEQKILEPVVEELRDEGVTVVFERPNWADGAATMNWIGSSPKKHQGCPGHVAFIEAVYEDERFNEDTKQWEIVEPDERVWDVEVEYYCTQRSLHEGTRSTKASKPAASDGKADAAAAKAAEKAKAERKAVLDGNKAWRAAETVRHDWLRKLVGGKKAPEGAQQFIAAELYDGGYVIRKALDGRNKFAIDLFDLADPEGAGDAQALLISLALILGALEESLHVGSWRTPDKRDASYLSQLVEWGYGPSAIEQSVIDKGKKR